MKKKIFIALLVLIMLQSMPRAEGSGFSFSKLYSQALGNSETVLLAENAFEQARLNSFNSFWDFLPQFSFGASYSQGWSDSSGSMTTTRPDGSISTSIGASVKLFDGFKNTTSYRNSVISLKKAKLDLRSAKENIFSAVLTSYLDILYYSELLDFYKEQNDVLEENKKEIEERITQGLVTESELLAVRVDILQNRKDLLSTENQISKQLLLLSRYTGKEINDLDTIDMDLEGDRLINELGFDSIETVEMDSAAVNDRVDLEKSLLDIESAKNDLKSVSWTFLPTLSLSGSYGASGSDWTHDNSSSSISVSLSIPFLSSPLSSINNIKLSKKVVEAKEITYQSLSETAEYEVSSAYMDYREQMEKKDLSQSSLDVNQENLSQKEAEYDLGLATATELQTARLNHRNAAITLVREKYLAMKSYYDYLLAAGSDIGILEK